ncbi:MAG: RNA polymerase-binding protein DksA [Moraxellaceae bacterium]|uniref:RNA polymerase-binding transcription factor DksA n=1 Tax=Acinetobacter tjernbergiae DSM 14971 = CIP 107465 TaxID=1120928 RepID=V2W788_9GAMM|nr:RNA polymerase-binding protein DksA [Acinetobacter tjernbergiae]ESK55864.1 RNA polymerase-binding protein DksA [Acinetobacter tjernbergiae DSM 14971 = CIP 107465]MBH2001909.1 RNA polymerase-binding protein DksA [Moraxellaceae bacterium]MBH2031152.1 RNA polymerase-binding protein DksA [Moraxellaceae bacterium]
MANDNQNQVLDEQTEVIDDQKAAVKRVRKTKPKASESGTTASLFGIAPYQPKKNEEYMSEGQLVHFRQILNAWKAELMSEVDRTLNTMQDESTALPDVNDRATQEEEFAIELRTRDRERKLIRKIEQSLETIQNEDYGFCETCGIEIGLRRLEARPTATLCIDCKTLAEIKEKQNNG